MEGMKMMSECDLFERVTSPIENTLREPLPPSITKHKSNHTKEYPSFNEWNDSCNHSSKKKRKEMRVTILYLYITGPNSIDPCVSIYWLTNLARDHKYLHIWFNVMHVLKP